MLKTLKSLPEGFQRRSRDLEAQHQRERASLADSVANSGPHVDDMRKKAHGGITFDSFSLILQLQQWVGSSAMGSSTMLVRTVGSV
ncbi:hypothetical protein TorRG33x02_144280 [Trema orientale]|uniref:Uncharacterized protein n=1 Tax=Trema orientale TaxID=63057 RepID=A0A2P5EW44_TREOI|nr:hypothetical protein TorRG33x02_144280 [Trema orientale]